MEELTAKLNVIQGSYYDFIVATQSYAKRKQTRLDAVMDYIDNNPDATPSSILRFIASQPDFFEYASYTKI